MTHFSALFWRLLRFTIHRLPYKREESVKKRLLKFVPCGCKFVMGQIMFIMGEVGWGWGHVKSKNPLSMEVSLGKSVICYGRTWNRPRFEITRPKVSLNTGKNSKSEKVRGSDTAAFKWASFLLLNRLRPYHVECTSSRPITEVKQRWAELVLGWVTAWEHLVL